MSILSDFFCRKLQWILATNKDLKEMEQQIMSAISDFAKAQNDFNDKIETAVDGLSGDIKSLNETILKLQNTAGQVTPEDQVLLDQIQTRSATVAAKLQALDGLTPPTPPTA